MKDKIILTLFMIQLNCAAILFLFGFMIIKEPSGDVASNWDMPTTIGSTSVSPDLLYTPKIDKLVLMIVDALRYDMIIRETPMMPNLQNLMKIKDHCVFKTIAEAPTVTLPRIKALMTGSVPGFIDVALNLKQFSGFDDNFLLQAKNKGLMSVFYGDETWVKVFPNMFNRSESTHSLLVTDFTEVDVNVTKNVNKELLETDWNIMILHYLGLDHIGHMQSPRSTLVPPKLIEMDNVVAQINAYISERATHKENIVFIIGSDHGMKDTGGHGGTTIPEITVPYIFLNYQCDYSLRAEKVQQIDITPLLSLLFGLPIPANSVGVLHTKMLSNFDPFSSLYALHYNTLMLYQKYKTKSLNGQIVVKNSTYSVKDLLIITEKLFELAIYKNFSGYEHVEASDYYDILQKEMSSTIVSQGVGYDVVSMVFALIFFGQILFSVFFKSKFISSLKRCLTFVTLFSMMILMTTVIEFKVQSQGNSSILNSTFYVICLSMFIWNICFLQPQTFPGYDIYNNAVYYDYFILGALVVHAILSLSTSFMEEEHIIWYYCFATFLLHIAIYGKFRKSIILLLAHTFLRYYNSSGVKNSADQNIGEWILDPNNSFCLLLVYYFGFCYFLSWCTKNSRTFNTFFKLRMPFRMERINQMFLQFMLYIVMLLKLTSGSISLPFIPSSVFKAYVNLNYLWVLLFVGLLLCGFWWYMVANFIHRIGPDEELLQRKSFVIYVLDVLIWIVGLLYAITCQPHNIIFLPYVLNYSELFKEYCCKKVFVLAVWHYGLGMVCFYFQGNSISLATVDVSAGYKAVVNPGLFVSTFLIYINTVGLLFLSLLSLFKNIYLISVSEKDEHQCLTVIGFLSTFYMFYFSLIVTLQRYHLFIWSVFAPKWLYMWVIVFTLSISVVITVVIEGMYYVTIRVRDFLTNKM